MKKKIDAQLSVKTKILNLIIKNVFFNHFTSGRSQLKTCEDHFIQKEA